MKKRAAAGLAGLAAAAVVGGTWAYWSQDLKVDNEFQTGKFDSDIVEKFTPEEGWLPGETVDKVVSVKNSGDVDMATMVVIDNGWIDTTGGNTPGLTFDKGNGLEYAAEIQWGDDVVVLNNIYMDEKSELVEKLGFTDEKIVNTLEEAKGKWVLVDINGNENESEKLYFIYNGVIGTEEGESQTPELITSVTMNPDIENGITEKTYKIENGEAVVSEAVDSMFNYDNAQYTMTINAKTVQMTADAVKEAFGAALEMDLEGDEEALIDAFLSQKEAYASEE